LSAGGQHGKSTLSASGAGSGAKALSVLWNQRWLRLNHLCRSGDKGPFNNSGAQE